MNKRIFTLFMGLSLCMIPLTAVGGDFDGSKSLLLSVIRVIECAPDGQCLERRPEDVNLPQFFKIDFGKKTIAPAGPGEVKPPSAIERMERVEGKVILQGAEEGMENVRDGLGWTIAISEDNGTVVLTASAENAAFIVFGACIPL
jgi:hypothetical protein